MANFTSIVDSKFGSHGSPWRSQLGLAKTYFKKEKEKEASPKNVGIAAFIIDTVITSYRIHYSNYYSFKIIQRFGMALANSS